MSRHVDLRGSGGMRASGRWHKRGSAVVYLTESPAGALLEVSVHTSASDVPPSFTLLSVVAEQDVAIETVDLEELPVEWASRAEATREIGSRWLREGRSALLRVPSALVPATFNVALNPKHVDATLVRVESQMRYPFDGRIKR